MNRAIVARVAFALIVATLSTPTPVLGAAPTLGGTLAPAQLVYERQPWIRIDNLSTVPVLVALEADDPAWTFSEPAFALEVGEVRTVDVLTAGEPTRIRAILTPRDPVPGVDYTTLALQGSARRLTDWEKLPWDLIALLALAAVLVAFWRVRRRLQRGQALVEMALVTPLLLLFLLGLIATGIYFTAATQQASASNTIAAWAAANPGATPAERDAFTGSVTACPATTVYAPGIVRVTLTCPTIAGDVLPLLPTSISTTGTAYVGG